MASRHLSQRDLKNEIRDLADRFPTASDDELFLMWFLHAYVTDDERKAHAALTGCPRDKGIDAILIDDRARTVVVVQGKYRQHLATKRESRGDIASFAELASSISGSNEGFRSLVTDLDPGTRRRIEEARNFVNKRDFRLWLYYVTMGRCSDELRSEAKRIVRSAEAKADIRIIDGREVLLLLADYLDGVAPPVPSLELEMEEGHGIHTDGALRRYDEKTGIESWVFSMNGRDVADIYNQTGDRLFARNVRGFLGDTNINMSMEYTLNHEASHFWYYNNGITIVCDDAEMIGKKGRDVLRVSNPQVINGQQTTRELQRNYAESRKSSVIVRVIRVSRQPDESPEKFERLISRIVVATNFQNKVLPSDLRSNDHKQIQIERELRKFGYYYLRKRKTKSEAWSSCGSVKDIIKKEDLARAVAACDLDPSIVRNVGKEGLFNDRYYNLVFPTTDPYYYLPRYWLVKQAEYEAGGYPERAYAKWLVVHFTWQQIESELRKKALSEGFADAWFKNRRSCDHLLHAIGHVFKASLKFYRYKKGKGAKALDVSGFFKRKGLDSAFETFWTSSRNGSRGKFRRYLRKWESALQTECELT